jgi:hypothetical protein
MKEYMAEISGTSTESLVSSKTKEQFTERLTGLKEKWTTRHKEGGKFYNFFLQRKPFRNCLTAEVRSLSGLGYPPDVYSQNANECMNSVIKRVAQNKKMDVIDCIENLRKVVAHQQNMKKLTMISRGELLVTDEFADAMVDEDDFFKMTKQQQNASFKKFCSVPLRRKESVEEIFCSKNQDDILENQSVQVSQVSITSIPYTILQSMFVDANRILAEDNHIHQFGDDKSFYVEDFTRDGQANHVKIRGRGEIACEPSCLRWASYKLCSHVIAVAERKNML